MNMSSIKNDIEIFFSEDATEVFICLHNPSREYTKNDIIGYLSDVEVTAGIIEANIDEMLAEKKSGKNYLVGQSQKPVDGKDGWFEFLFDTDVDTRPKVLHDGSVDYSSYGNVPSVEEGQKLVKYHPATPSRDGVNYRGEILIAAKGRELARLKGKGFYTSKDDRTYFAKLSGRAVYQDGRLVVENELVIDGDVSLSTGDINFSDDIHIRGNVLTGVVVASAKGNIVVDGYVEACELYAGKDVVLKNGMQGNGRGKIISGGSVSGKFFEQLAIQAKGDVKANAIMNSHVTAGRDVIVSGRFGIIIGGDVSAERAISATIVGNMAEVKTQLTAGVAENLFIQLSQKEKEQEELEERLKKIADAISQIAILAEKTKSEDLNPKKLKLIRSKVEVEKAINDKIREKQILMERMSRANSARVTVQKMLYPGTKISINGVNAAITEEINHAEITAKGSVIEIK